MTLSLTSPCPCDVEQTGVDHGKIGATTVGNWEFGTWGGVVETWGDQRW